MNAQTFYVDNQLTSDCTGNYSIANRNCSGSDGNAYNTLARAASSAVAGTTVLIRGGVFADQLSPQNSGTEGNYITFKNYGNEVVEITGASLSPAIWIFEKNYIAGARELTLDKQLTWSSGQGVSLSYNGTKPDLGAFEYGSILSVNDEVFDAAISIFPNSSNDSLTIDLKNYNLKKVIVYNELGQQIKEVTAREVDISNMSAGIYFFKII